MTSGQDQPIRLTFRYHFGFFIHFSHFILQLPHQSSSIVSASSDNFTTQVAQVVAESFRQVGLTPGSLSSPRSSPFEPSSSDSIEMRWKKKLQRSLSLREYFWPPQWARVRLEKLTQNAARGITKPSTVNLAGDVTVQVGAGDDSVEVGASQMDFIDGFDYAVKIMTELNFSPSEIASRQEFVRWLFGTHL